MKNQPRIIIFFQKKEKKGKDYLLPFCLWEKKGNFISKILNGFMDSLAS